ncbi:MAG: dipeptidase PepE [Acidobacteria bacterium]|nr:dipeptidase PepE [Acidobacteriota bacterium]
MSKKLLLLSNSRNYGQGYLAHAEKEIKNFLTTDIKEVLFIPFAAVRFSYDEYTNIVSSKFTELGYKVKSIHQTDDYNQAIRTAQAIIVGGGNTFQLLKCFYENNILELVRNRVNEGLLYMGWSAGANMACPTIKTTNDMPITEPPSFNALNLIPFQINPHYTEATLANHQGETRDERLAEFLVLNPSTYVVGLREGSMMQLTDSNLELLGEKTLKVLRQGQEIKEYTSKDSLQFLLG